MPEAAEVESILKEAATAVFAIMLDWPPEFGAFEDVFEGEQERVAASVAVAGSIEFKVSFYSSALMARRLTCRLLRVAEAELHGNDAVNDTVGELTNMLAGQIKLKLSQTGHVCFQTAPTVVRGANFQVAAPSSSLRKSVTLKCPGGGALLEAIFIDRAGSAKELFGSGGTSGKKPGRGTQMAWRGCGSCRQAIRHVTLISLTFSH